MRRYEETGKFLWLLFCVSLLCCAVIYKLIIEGKVQDHESEVIKITEKMIRVLLTTVLICTMMFTPVMAEEENKGSGGAIYFDNKGPITNTTFTESTGGSGGAINFSR